MILVANEDHSGAKSGGLQIPLISKFDMPWRNISNSNAKRKDTYEKKDQPEVKVKIRPYELLLVLINRLYSMSFHILFNTSNLVSRHHIYKA